MDRSASEACPWDTDLPLDQTVFDAMPCIVSVQDREFRVIRGNRKFEGEFGKRIGERCYRVYKGLDGICPDCSVAKTFEDGQVHHSEETVIKRSGEEATILVTTAPIFDPEQRVNAAIEMSLDITGLRTLQAQLKRSEERYRILFNNQPNPILVLSLDGFRVVDVNDTALTAYGYTREEFKQGGFLGLAPKDVRKRMEQVLRQQGKEILRVPHHRKDGAQMIGNIRVSYPQEAMKGLAIVTVSDVTDRVRTEEQLAQASKLATLGQMSAGVAHELNQPLSVIKSAATFLSFLSKKVIEKGAGESQNAPPVVTIQTDVLRSLADEIDSHVDRATRIIQHLRDFGRKSEFSRTEVDVNDCIRSVFTMLGTQLYNRGIRHHLNLEESVPPVMADKNRLQQVFLNLVINARDAIEERLQKDRELQEEMGLFVTTFTKGGRVVAAFRDTGCGMPESIRGKIFDPFFTTKEVGKGTGLGLSISYGIVKDYDGEIVVESTPGEGTTFVISFPAVGRDL
jgi:histidine kinase